MGGEIGSPKGWEGATEHMSRVFWPLPSFLYIQVPQIYGFL